MAPDAQANPGAPAQRVAQLSLSLYAVICEGKISNYACCNAWKGGLQAQTLVKSNNPYLWGLKHHTHP